MTARLLPFKKHNYSLQQKPVVIGSWGPALLQNLNYVTLRSGDSKVQTCICMSSCSCSAFLINKMAKQLNDAVIP
jgi:hypothetical protein